MEVQTGNLSSQEVKGEYQKFTGLNSPLSYMSLHVSTCLYPLKRRPTNMDQVMQFVQPSLQFVKDSIQLVKRCTKPDRTEVPEDCHGRRDSIFYQGIHWLLRETDPHPY